MEILRAELGVVFADCVGNTPTWRDLEKLPYCTAVIKEGLRLDLIPLVTDRQLTARTLE